MITHVVLLEPHPALSVDDRRSILGAIETAIASCPSVRGCRIGRRVRHGLPGYEQGMHQDFQYALMLEFEDADRLREYLAAPAHAGMGELFTRATAAALAYDYEMVDLKDAGRIL